MHIIENGVTTCTYVVDAMETPLKAFYYATSAAEYQLFVEDKPGYEGTQKGYCQEVS